MLQDYLLTMGFIVDQNLTNASSCTKVKTRLTKLSSVVELIDITLKKKSVRLSPTKSVNSLCLYVKNVPVFPQPSVHTDTRAGIFHFTLRLEIVSSLLCCSSWFRLPLTLAGTQPAVTFTLALHICSVQQDLKQQNTNTVCIRMQSSLIRMKLQIHFILNIH